MKLTDRDKYEKALKEVYKDDWEQIDRWTKKFFQTGSKKASIELDKLLGEHTYPAMIEQMLLEDFSKELHKRRLYNGKTDSK
jgi:hypothetical protein